MGETKGQPRKKSIKDMSASGKDVVEHVFAVFNMFNKSETVTVANAGFSPKIRAEKVASLHPALCESVDALARFYSKSWSESKADTSEQIDITVDGQKVGTFTANWKADFGIVSSSLTTTCE